MATASLWSKQGGVDHEVPAGQRHPGVDHLQRSLHHEAEGSVGRQELQPGVVAILISL